MILWYAAGAVFGVWNVFQSSGLDFRLVALGALGPLLLDLPFGHQAIGHTLLLSVVALTAAMVATTGRGRRLVRRRLIGLPIGLFGGLVLSGAWAHPEVFWWPLLGTEFGDVPLLPALPLALALEALGGLAAVWCWRRFGLADRQRRSEFVRSGRLEVVAS